MAAFEISINGQPLCTVGAGNVDQITAVVSWLRSTGKDGKTREGAKLGVGVGPLGNTKNQPSERLRLGDEITIRIIDSGSVRAVDDIAANSPSTNQPFRLFPD